MEQTQQSDILQNNWITKKSYNEHWLVAIEHTFSNITVTTYHFYCESFVCGYSLKCGEEADTEAESAITFLELYFLFEL